MQTHDGCFASRHEANVIKVLGVCTYLQPTWTVVLESAFRIIEVGLLNVPKTKRVNRKQVLSFLHFASWVQRRKREVWLADGDLHGTQDRRPPLRSVTLGGPGTGKTTLNSICKAFAHFCLGDECDRTGALSHAAARIAGGRTFHSMYRLPVKCIGIGRWEMI